MAVSHTVVDVTSDSVDNGLILAVFCGLGDEVDEIPESSSEAFRFFVAGSSLDTESADEETLSYAPVTGRISPPEFETNKVGFGTVESEFTPVTAGVKVWLCFAGLDDLVHENRDRLYGTDLT